jgi:hypothetical protein
MAGAALVLVLAVVACGGNGSDASRTPDSKPGAELKTSIEGSCKLAETGSEISLTYSVDLQGSGQITRVRLFVDGAKTEESGRTSERTFTRTANIKVPDRTMHTFEVAAEAGSLRSTASTTIPCVAPTKGPTL